MKRLHELAVKAGPCLHRSKRRNSELGLTDTGMTAEHLAYELRITGRPMHQFKKDLKDAGLPYLALFDRFYAELP